jgi:tetratricopeptide (TPR) repeat protein
MCIMVLGGCQRQTRDESERIQQEISSRTLKTDSLRQALRYLAQTTPGNKANLNKEIRVLLNTWLKSVEADKFSFQESRLLAGLDPKLLSEIGCASAEKQQFGPSDMEYLYECQMMKQLSKWIVQGPVHDRLLVPTLNRKMESLDGELALKLENAYKLFDWTIRNIKLAGIESSQVTVKTADPRAPLSDAGVGYTLLPWQAALFCSADFIVRGRVFSALAKQQGIETCWISVGAAPGEPGDLFAIGVLIGQELLLFEPKLGLPIQDPDSEDWATLQDVIKTERILRRLNLPQYEYAFDQASMTSIQLLIDAVPFSASRRARILEDSLIGDERMVVAANLDQVAERLSKSVPNSTVAIWMTPLLAQLYSESLSERLRQTTEFAMRYMAENAIWLIENSVSTGRLLHLSGDFENTLDRQGALKTYMNARVDDDSLRKLAYNPDIQNALGLVRGDNESREQFEARIVQAQTLFVRSKFDVAFLLAQLHFDRGDYSSAAYWLRDRVLNDLRSQRWHAPAWYTLARVYSELGEWDLAEEALTKPTIEEGSQIPAFVINAQDPGNRLRLRFLRRMRSKIESTAEPEAATQPEATAEPEAAAEPKSTAEPESAD